MRLGMMNATQPFNMKRSSIIRMMRYYMVVRRTLFARLLSQCTILECPANFLMSQYLRTICTLVVRYGIPVLVRILVGVLCLQNLLAIGLVVFSHPQIIAVAALTVQTVGSFLMSIELA